MTTTVVNVGTLTAYLRDLVESDESLQDVWVEGEVSSYTVPGSGHAYFTIKDEQSAIDCVMWKIVRLRQSFQPKPGDKVFVHGSVSVYERNSRLQVKADVVHPAGVGLLQLQLEQLRQRLEAEGLFDPSRKRPLPLFPMRIGVVTSPTGAVWHDIQRVLRRRFPMAELVLAPAVVQGDQAPNSVVAALTQVQDEGVDVVIVARGGGSVEDLWAFNDERIARAIFACRVPVVSAIGHETDITIADFVADVRASTPSVAAELVSPDLEDFRLIVEDFANRTRAAISTNLATRIGMVDALTHRLARVSPQSLVSRMQADLDASHHRLKLAGAVSLERMTAELLLSTTALAALNPQAVLARGYAMFATDDDNRPVHSIHQVTVGSRIVATLADGQVRANVTSTTPARGS